MILEENPRDAYNVLSDPEIFDTISEDGMKVVKMPDGVLYLCGYAPELIGCFIVHKTSGISGSCHVQVLPEHREEHTDRFCHDVIEWVWDNTELLKLTAEIPFLYPNVRDCALRHGFEIEGVNKLSFRKNGKIHDQWYLGISR